MTPPVFTYSDAAHSRRPTPKHGRARYAAAYLSPAWVPTKLWVGRYFVQCSYSFSAGKLPCDTQMMDFPQLWFWWVQPIPHRLWTLPLWAGSTPCEEAPQASGDNWRRPTFIYPAFNLLKHPVIGTASFWHCRLALDELQYLRCFYAWWSNVWLLLNLASLRSFL